MAEEYFLIKKTGNTVLVSDGVEHEVGWNEKPNGDKTFYQHPTPEEHLSGVKVKERLISDIPETRKEE
jgi:hypothetical protein